MSKTTTNTCQFLIGKVQRNADKIAIEKQIADCANSL